MKTPRNTYGKSESRLEGAGMNKQNVLEPMWRGAVEPWSRQPGPLGFSSTWYNPRLQGSKNGPCMERDYLITEPPGGAAHASSPTQVSPADPLPPAVVPGVR